MKQFKYVKMKNNEIEQDQQCQAFCFNKDNSILIFAFDIHIKVYEFKFGQLKQIQLLSGHYRGVQTLDFMKINRYQSGLKIEAVNIYINLLDIFLGFIVWQQVRMKIQLYQEMVMANYIFG
ncbi:unnamed protein product [Paramecium sonneborni]|uniref:WD40-repeat-containing domain n=1 Tax=Paramecium sonneborni TaxID=65129 RepID=A0A8S1RBK9_9CILI|nr:unnamed protein product [Paramecium sonneborni]